ncbi:hypothetical protein I5L01_15605 [Erythrobacter sp. YJ-T3-07]|nr:hypothetical protein [Erythrobacter sp. YJ-T3-07]
MARVKGDEKDQIVGIALFKLRFGGWRDPHLDFAASSQQAELHADVFAGEDDGPPLREFVGDPVLDGFKERLRTDGQAFPEIDEDLLSKLTKYLWSPSRPLAYPPIHRSP